MDYELPGEASSSLELHQSKPVLAILTVEDEVQFFRGNRNNFADLLRIGAEFGFITYVVTVNQVQLTKKKIKGYGYSEDTRTWYQRLYPLPDVIYNRIPYREDEMQSTVRRKIEALRRHPRIRFFNPAFFNKWSLFEWLKLSGKTRPYIPSTRRMISSVSLRRMLRKHNFLYLKPVSGKAGAGIMTIQHTPGQPKPYCLRIQVKRRSVTFRCVTLAKLWSRVKQECSSEAYIAQQGIDLASYHDRPFDLRALVQKNQSGKWDFTGVGARLAGASSITTHVPRGGSIEDPERLLVHVFGPDHAQRIMSKVRNTALLIARQIERASMCQLGEMSMDLGIDKKGGIWFFEANSKPMKFDEPHIRKKSLERIYHYSLYLVKHKLGKTGGGKYADQTGYTR